MRPHPGFPAVVVALLAAVSCTDATGPELQLGYYRATTINGQSGQVTIAATLTCDEQLFRASLTLAAGGSFDLSSQVIQDCTRGGGGISAAVMDVSGSWVRAGDHLTLTISGSAPFEAGFDNGHLSATFPAGATTFPVEVAMTFTWFQFPPP